MRTNRAIVVVGASRECFKEADTVHVARYSIDVERLGLSQFSPSVLDRPFTSCVPLTLTHTTV